MAQKEPLLVTLSEEDETRLRDLWKELQRAGRRGTALFVGPRLTFNTWLVRCGVERAMQLAQELAAADVAPTSGTVGMTMTKPQSPTTKRAKTAQTPEPRGRGRPPNPPDAPKTKSSTFKLPVGMTDRIKRAVDVMRPIDPAAPRNMTDFVIAAIEEKLDKVPARPARKTSK
jgi:hypothetical protein